MAKGLKEFKAAVQANDKMRARFKSLKTIDDVVAMAKAEGYSFSVAEIEELSSVSAEDLTMVSGGVEGRRDFSTVGFFVNF